MNDASSLPLLLIATALFVLGMIFGAKIIEKSFIKISARFSINVFFLGFVVLGILTSLPEISIVIFSAKSSPEISLGNLVGGTLVVLTLVLGISAIKYKGIEFRGKFRRRELFSALFIISLLVFVLLDGKLSVAEGISLILIYLLYAAYIFIRFRNTKRESLLKRLELVKKTDSIISIFLSLFGVALLLSSAMLTISTIEEIANVVQIPKAIIGLFLLGIGTNLVELFILFTSRPHGENSLAVGDFLGSVTLNPPTLGLLAILSGGFVISDFVSLIPTLVLVLFAVLFFAILSFTDRILTPREGIILIGVYVSFIITELIVSLYR